MKQLLSIRLFLAFALTVSSFLVALALPTGSASAYQCPGATSGGAPYYYKDGYCWEPNYKEQKVAGTYQNVPKENGGCGDWGTANSSGCGTYVCPNGSKTKNSNSCGSEWVRNPSDDKKVAVQPVHDDGTPVTDWKCDNGKSVGNNCEIQDCLGTNNQTDLFCETQYGTKVPAQTEDPTKSANGVSNYCDRTYVSQGNDNQSANRAACRAGQENRDCNQYQGAQRTACDAGRANQPAGNSPEGTNTDTSNNASGGTGGNGQCGKAKVNILDCGTSEEGAPAFQALLTMILNIMSIGVGILAVGGIVYGAIMYASAQDNAGQVQKAIGIITNTVIGLLIYIFMYAIVNWLVPGGVLG